MATTKRDAQQKEQLQPTEDTAALFRSAEDFIRQEDYLQALKVCNKLPLDADSGRARLFCLLQLGRWQAAFEVLKKLREDGKEKPESFLFEQAYCLYRLNKPQKGLELLQAHTPHASALSEAERLRLTHLKAQILHRLGEYEACRAIYAELLDGDKDNEAVLANFLAASVCADASRRLQGEAKQEASSLIAASLWQQVERNLETTYEVPFNAACVAIQNEDLELAERLLAKARAACTGEDAGEETIALGDCAAIIAQEAFVAFQQGRYGDSQRLCAQVLRAAESRKLGEEAEEIDLSVLVVAQTNALACDGASSGDKRDSAFPGANLDDAIKRLSCGSNQNLEQKLTRSQAQLLAVNRCVAFIQTGRLEEARRLLTAFSSKFGDKQPPKLLLLHAAFHLASNNPRKAEERLRLLANLPSPPLPLLEAVRGRLALATLRMAARDATGASRMLEEARALLLPAAAPQGPVGAGKATSGSFGPGEGPSVCRQLLLEVATLQQLAGDEAGAVQSLTDQVELYKESKEDASAAEMAVKLLLTAAKANASLHRWQAALAQSREASALAPRGSAQHLLALAGIAEATTELGQPISAEVLAALRERLPERVRLIDSDELERQEAVPAAALLLRGKVPGTKEIVSEAEKARKGTKRKRRCPRWPKGFDPNQPRMPPDPERWLPKVERLGRKKVLRRRKEAGRGGTQGSVLPGTADATTGFRNTGPSTAKTEAARDTARTATGRKKRSTRK